MWVNKIHAYRGPREGDWLGRGLRAKKRLRINLLIPYKNRNTIVLRRLPVSITPRKRMAAIVALPAR